MNPSPENLPGQRPENRTEPASETQHASEPPPLPLTLLAEEASPTPTPTPEPVEPEVIWPPPPAIDRWAHRRGEPRLFALLWIAWLMLSSALVLARLGSSGVLDPAVARPVTRVLFVLIMAGGTVLWPMIRLSQVMPRSNPLPGVLLDVAIIYLTSQIVIWPQLFLAFWPLEVLQAVSVCQLAWLAVVGGVLAWMMSKERHFPEDDLRSSLRRAGRMGVILAVAAGGCLLPALLGWDALGERPDPDLLMLASPLTAPFELSRDRFWSGSSAKVAPEHWQILRWTLACGGVILVGAWLEGRRPPVAKSTEAA